MAVEGGKEATEEVEEPAGEVVDFAKEKMAEIHEAVERAYLGEVEEKDVDVVPEALVIGAGITGMYAALGIADAGFKVHLVEQKQYIG
ncbi:MAG: FAD-binding protein, partial [Canidatus Methanoxibalbensis ujae]|nr:FAD-binding protein [Candidatus Methanoxibalbensis ujae]